MGNTVYMSATLMAEHVMAIINQIEKAPGADQLDDLSKSAILKSASDIYNHKAERDTILAALMKELNR